MKNQQKPTQTPQDGTETNTTKTQQPSTQNGSEAENTKSRERQQEQKNNPQNPGAGKEHHVGDIEEPEQSKNEGDVKKIKDPDPTIPEKGNHPVAGKDEAYARTLNTPGKNESASKGEFTESDELDTEEDFEDETSETSDISDEEQDEEDPNTSDRN